MSRLRHLHLSMTRYLRSVSPLCRADKLFANAYDAQDAGYALTKDKNAVDCGQCLRILRPDSVRLDGTRVTGVVGT